MKRRTRFVLLALCVALTTSLWAEPHIRIAKRLNFYTPREYVWLNNEEIVYRDMSSLDDLWYYNLRTDEKRKLFAGNEDIMLLRIPNSYPSSANGRDIYIRSRDKGEINGNYKIFSVDTQELKPYSEEDPSEAKNFGEEQVGYEAGKTEDGPIYYIHHIKSGVLEEYSHTWEESGLEFIRFWENYSIGISDTINNWAIINQSRTGGGSSINYITRFDEDGFEPLRPLIMDGNEPNKDVSYGAYFLRDGNILYGEYLDYDRYGAYGQLKICDKEGNHLYTFENFIYWYDPSNRYSMSPNRRYIIVGGNSLDNTSTNSNCLLEIVYD
jgi:hypothetical protein